MKRWPSIAYLYISLLTANIKRSAGRPGSWHNMSIATWLALNLLSITIGLLGSFVIPVVLGTQMSSAAPSLAEYGNLYMGTHLKTSSLALKRKACLRLGRGTFLYYGLILLWVWPLAVSGAIGMFTPLPISMNMSKVTILLTWNFCLAICSSGVSIAARLIPGPRLNVIRVILIGCLSLLRCTGLLLFAR